MYFCSMIQRKQTLYLLAAFVLQLLTALYATQMQFINFQGLDAYSYHFVSAGLALLLLLIIVLFKRRPLQCKLCLLALLVLIGLVVVTFFGVLSEGFVWQRELLLGSDGLSIVCIVMAYLAIKKDEALVRSIDRIR